MDKIWPKKLGAKRYFTTHQNEKGTDDSEECHKQKMREFIDREAKSEEMPNPMCRGRHELALKFGDAKKPCQGCMKSIRHISVRSKLQYSSHCLLQ
jgi:hypothetical protein